jgi:hypothetical protein
MTSLAYPGCIRELYESEIFGEASSLALLAVAKNEREKYHIGTLLQLETETKARLRPFLFRHGISLSEQMDLGEIPGYVAAYQANTWKDFTGAITPVIQGYVSRFEEIAGAGPAEDRDVLQSMVRHEKAILRWVQKESQGVTAGSLDDIVAQLQYPLPKPPGVLG